MRRLIALAALLLVACSSAPARPEIVAHRGASAEAPENTLAAIERAIELGADRVELDVRATRDGVPVLFHDETLERTTDGRGRLADKTLAELLTLDAGSWKDARYAGERVPTLEQAARACAGRVAVFLDVKVDGQGDAIRAALRASGIPERDVIVGLWHDPQIRELLADRGEVTLAFIGDAPAGAGGRWLSLLHWTGFRVVSLDWPTVTTRVVNAARELEIGLHVWTLNDAEAMQAAVLMKVAGILTDDPALLARVLDGDGDAAGD